MQALETKSVQLVEVRGYYRDFSILAKHVGPDGWLATAKMGDNKILGWDAFDASEDAITEMVCLIDQKYADGSLKIHTVRDLLGREDIFCDWDSMPEISLDSQLGKRISKFYKAAVACDMADDGVDFAKTMEVLKDMIAKQS